MKCHCTYCGEITRTLIFFLFLIGVVFLVLSKYGARQPDVQSEAVEIFNGTAMVLVYPDSTSGNKGRAKAVAPVMQLAPPIEMNLHAIANMSKKNMTQSFVNFKRDGETEAATLIPPTRDSTLPQTQPYAGDQVGIMVNNNNPQLNAFLRQQRAQAFALRTQQQQQQQQQMQRRPPTAIPIGEGGRLQGTIPNKYSYGASRSLSGGVGGQSQLGFTRRSSVVGGSLPGVRYASRYAAAAAGGGDFMDSSPQRRMTGGVGTGYELPSFRPNAPVTMRYAQRASSDMLRGGLSKGNTPQGSTLPAGLQQQQNQRAPAAGA